MNTTAAKLSDDVLNGAEAIAAEIDEPLWRTYRLLEGKHIPGKKLMGKWISTRSALRAHYDRLLNGSC